MTAHDARTRPMDPVRTLIPAPRRLPATRCRTVEDCQVPKRLRNTNEITAVSSNAGQHI